VVVANPVSQLIYLSERIERDYALMDDLHR